MTAAENKKTNLSNGVNSFDANIDGSLVQFINRNTTPYPVEVGGPKFDLVPVTKQKDIMVNVARMHAEQEYNRIMELVGVLQKQANSIKRRLELTDKIHKAHYQFQIYHGQTYWLCYDHDKKITRLVLNGPNNWSSSAPKEYEYICQVKWLGDHTWVEIDNFGKIVE